MVIGTSVIFVSLLVFGLIYTGIFRALDADATSGLGLFLILALVYVIVLAITWVMGPARHHVSVGSLGLRLPSSRSKFQLFLPLLVLAASLALTAIYAAVISVLGFDLPESLPSDFDLEGPRIIGGLALVIILWGPLAEEIFFRGFVFSGLVGRLGVVGAALISSLLFAIAHVDPSRWVDTLILVPPIFITGLLLAWLYHKTGSIWSAFAAHALQNALAFAVGINS